MTAATPKSSLRTAIASQPIKAFLLILYPLSWILFLPAVLGKSGVGVIPVDIPAQPSILLVSLFGLTGIAFLVTQIADGKPGTRALRRHYCGSRLDLSGTYWRCLARPYCSCWSVS